MIASCMPELPEVETIARGLAERLTGLHIDGVHLHRPDMLHGNAGSTEQLVGRRIADVRRRGKLVCVSLADSREPISVFVHLGMTGRLLVVELNQPLERHTHLQVTFSRRGLELRFCDPRRFGGIWLVGNCADGTDDGNGWQGRRLPPIAADPLTVTLPQMRVLLNRRRQIKALLLDQQPLSGLGNIYCDEMLFRAGVHPLTLAADLSPDATARLRRAMRRVLAEAIRAGGSSISDYRNADNQPGRFQDHHRVYNRAGQPCCRCGTTIQRLVVAGRGTYICPVCQRITVASANSCAGRGGG